MYKIIGANQVEYGPVTDDQLRAWITEGRVNGQTPAQAAGDTTWKPLSMFPEFAALFPAGPAAAPTPFASAMGVPAASAGDGHARASSMVKGPAIALIVTSSLYLLWSIFYAVVIIIQLSSGTFQPRQTFGYNRALQDPQMAHMVQVGMVCGVCFAILLGACMLFGAIRMLNLKSYGFCIAACIAAMLPCSLCCILSLGFGIWGLIVLNKPEVKQYFS